MIDGIQFTFYTPNPRSHILDFPLWEIKVFEQTYKKVDNVKTANLRGLELKLKPSSKGGYFLIINGSIHKFYNLGEHNYDQFDFSHLVQAIDSLIDLTNLNPTECILHGLEIGLNILLPFSPLRILKNIVCYNSHPFTNINKRNARMGLQCSLNQYSLKVYDKAEQSGIDCGYIIRFEVSINKMQFLAKYDIINLSDLQHLEKVYPLLNVLLDAAKGIVWTDTSANLKNMTNSEQKLWLYLSNPKVWEQMDKRKRYKSVRKLEILLTNHGKTIDLLPSIIRTWNTLFSCEMEAEKQGLFYHDFMDVEAHKKGTILPYTCKGKKSPKVLKNPTPLNTSLSIEDTYLSKNNMPIIASQKRYCITCKNDISMQNENSIFCSYKQYGKPAKKCRNTNSNIRRNKKRIINMAIKNSKNVIINYVGEKKINTDITNPSSIIISQSLLDTIEFIKMQQ